MEQARLLALTALLTFLIWISADSLVTETETLTMSISVEPAEDPSDMLLQPVNPPAAFDVKVNGPRKLLEQLRVQRIHHVRLRLRDREDGETEIPLREKLLEQWEYAPRLSILMVTPPALQVRVDHWTRVPAQVILKPTRLLYQSPPVLERREVDIRLPKSRWQELQRAGRQIHAEIDADDAMRNQPRGAVVDIQAAVVTTHLGDDVTAIPPRIKMTAALSEDRVEAEIRAVPILVGVSVENFGKPFRIAKPPDGPDLRVFTTIRVAGPTEAVEKIRSREIYVAGWIQLKEADFDDLGTVKRKFPEYHLPPEVSLIDPGEAIEFIIEKRSE